MIGKFFADNQIPRNVIEDAKKLIYQTIMGIVEKEKTAKKTIDIMALNYDGNIKVRLRDDGVAPKPIELESDDRISRLSVMGYNNTVIKIPVL